MADNENENEKTCKELAEEEIALLSNILSEFKLLNETICGHSASGGDDSSESSSNG